MHGDLVQVVQKTAQEILVAHQALRPLAALQLQQPLVELIVAVVAVVLAIRHPMLQDQAAPELL
jgi:hypothetical protein